VAGYLARLAETHPAIIRQEPRRDNHHYWRIDFQQDRTLPVSPHHRCPAFSNGVATESHSFCRGAGVSQVAQPSTSPGTYRRISHHMLPTFFFFCFKLPIPRHPGMNSIIYLNFPLATERRVHKWHLAAIPTTAKDMVGLFFRPLAGQCQDRRCLFR